MIIEMIRKFKLFITCESSDKNYFVKIKFESLDDMQSLHSTLLEKITGK